MRGGLHPLVRPRPAPNLVSRPDYLMKGYDQDHRIVYGTGKVVPADAVMARAEEVFRNAAVAYIDVRSSRNNCFQARLRRDPIPG